MVVGAEPEAERLAFEAVGAWYTLNPERVVFTVYIWMYIYKKNVFIYIYTAHIYIYSVYIYIFIYICVYIPYPPCV